MRAIFALLVALSAAATGSLHQAATRDDPISQVAPGQEDKPKESAAKKHRGKFTISKETTYVTGPLDKDGYIDYPTALNERLGKGVTPENNANVLLWKALGPQLEKKTMPAEFFKLMGMEPPPEKGEYFVDLTSYLRKQFNTDPSESAEIEEQLIRCAQRPWKSEEFPTVASWLKANEKPLSLVVDATKLPQYYSPYVLTQTEKGSPGLISAVLPEGVQKCRAFANALIARAMLKVSQGASGEAWQDLLACHRLGWLVGRGGMIIDALVGIAIDGVACKADLAFLAETKPNAKRIEHCLRDLQNLPTFPALADKLDLGERFLFLDSAMGMAREGAVPDDPLLRIFQNFPLIGKLDAAIDWNPTMQSGNRFYDRTVAALRETDRDLRKKSLEQIDEELRGLKQKWDKELQRFEDELKKLQAKSPNAMSRAELIERIVKARDQMIGDILISMLAPSVNKMPRAWDRVQQVHDNLRIAFALEWYQRDNRRHPKKLEDLAPKYLKEIPADIFSGKSLIYRPNEKGYLLYSVGYYGKDEGGRGLEDEPMGWNISVRMPLPDLPGK
jgi:hypothetical protein